MESFLTGRFRLLGNGWMTPRPDRASFLPGDRIASGNQTWLVLGGGHAVRDPAGPDLRDAPEPFPAEPLAPGIAQDWLDNARANGPLAARSASLTAGDLAGRPCVIAGAGPSLDAAVELLAMRRHTHLIAVQRAFDLLPGANSFLSICESYEPVPRAGTGALLRVTSAARGEGWREVRFFAPAGGSEAAQLVRRLHPTLTPIDGIREPMLAALHVAVRWGCNPIILIGADHCFAGEVNPADSALAQVELRTRAGATAPHAVPPLVVRDTRGLWVGTTPALVREALAIAGAAELLAERGIRVVNASGRGLIGPRVPALQLADALRDAGRTSLAHIRASRRTARESGKPC